MKTKLKKDVPYKFNSQRWSSLLVAHPQKYKKIDMMFFFLEKYIMSSWLPKALIWLQTEPMKSIYTLKINKYIDNSE